MSLPQLLAEYGYLAVFVGSLLEGETILLLAGFAAHQGYLSLPLIMGVAWLGGTLGDQVFYWVGRRWGLVLLRRRPGMRRGARRVRALLRRHHGWVIVSVRFMYGLRIVGPIAIGMSDVAPRRFVLFNALGAVLWALVVPSVGYAFGESVQFALNHLDRYESWGLPVAAAIVAWILWMGRRRPP